MSASVAQAQVVDTTDDEPENPYGTGAGLSVQLTNSGFGLGGYMQWAFNPSTSFITELSISSGKDRREQKFFDWFGNSVVPNKANYFLMMPLRVGLHRRMFKESIRENFRPFVQGSIGPTLGWQWPYFADNNGNGVLDRETEQQYGSLESLFKGESRYGFGGTVGVGVFWGVSRRVTQGVRLSYTFNYFLNEVQLMEADPSIENASRKYFGTPAITLIFGRLW